MQKLAIIVPILLVIAMVSYIFLSSKKSSVTQTTPTSSQSEPTKTIQPTANVQTIQSGGSSFTDSQNVFSILYPADYKLDTTDPIHPRIYKTGATQKGQTEMYDGVVVVFETIQLNGKPLSTWVDEQIKTLAADGVSQLVSPKQALTVKTYPGFTYELRGLGDAKTYVLQKNTSSKYAVVITAMVADPEQVGYQKDVDTILSTLQILQ